MSRMLRRMSLSGMMLFILFATGVIRPGLAGIAAQNPPQVSGVSAGSLKVTGATWNFDADVSSAGSPWTSVIVTNLSSCERPLPIPGTAQAGAIVFTAQLSPVPSQTSQVTLQGDLLPLRGSSASGYVMLVVPPAGETHVNAGLFGLEQFAIDNTLTVCLISGPGTPGGSGSSSTLTGQVLSDMQKVLSLGYDVTGVVTTYGPDGSSFIGISGAKLNNADGGPQWVFFFTGASYLGTDTAVPSSFLALAGTPAAGQISVSYQNYAPGDPLCCPTLPPVTITYTWNGSTVTPSGTPPGH